VDVEPQLLPKLLDLAKYLNLYRLKLRGSMHRGHDG